MVSTPRAAIFDAMPSIVPSDIAKLDRAQHHLDELKEAINLPLIDFINDTLSFLRDMVVSGLVPYVRT